MIRVDRGGDVTYHGPGQLVGYPLLTVGPGPHRGPHHVRPGRAGGDRGPGRPGHPPGHGGTATRLPGRLGGVDDDDGGGRGGAATGPRKICAIGVRTSRGRTTHGFALNVHPDLSMFGHIVPCGIADKPVTSLEAEGRRGVDDRGGGGRRHLGAVGVGRGRRHPAGDRRARGPTGGGVPVRSAYRGARPRPAAQAGRRRTRCRGPDAGEEAVLAAGRGPNGRRLPRAQARTPRPRSGHRVRGGRLPQHLRVLVGRDRHLHDQRFALHPGLRVLPGRHPPPPASRRR